MWSNFIVRRCWIFQLKPHGDLSFAARLQEVRLAFFSLLSQMMTWRRCDLQGAAAPGKEPSKIMKLLQWFKMLLSAQTRCHLAHATQHCLRALVSRWNYAALDCYFLFMTLFFDTGANCKCVLWIGNPGRAQSLQFRTEGSIDRVQRLVLHNTAWGKIQTSAFFFSTSIECSSSPECQFIQTPDLHIWLHSHTYILY